MSILEPREGLLILEDGSTYRGLVAAPGTAYGEVVFNTSMTGYQEILTDPSYRRQIVVMTQPHIGNYGTRDDEAESGKPWAAGFLARRFTARASSHGSELDLLEYLEKYQVPALGGIDTRSLVRRLREKGAMRGAVTDRVDEESLADVRRELDALPPMTGQALVGEVTRRDELALEPLGPAQAEQDAHVEGPHIALFDFGAKRSIARQLRLRGARVTVVPADTSAQRCRDLGVDGVMLSNGPGDPEPLTDIVAEVRKLIEHDMPIFGICLGHQLLGLAVGGSTYKLKFGHHGGNQPVKDLDTGRVSITSQNHGFAVDEQSLPAHCRVTHRNLNDGTVEGLALADKPVFSVQYHPEAAPGPHDAWGLFDRFLDSLSPS